MSDFWLFLYIYFIPCLYRFREIVLFQNSAIQLFMLMEHLTENAVIFRTKKSLRWYIFPKMFWKPSYSTYISYADMSIRPATDKYGRTIWTDLTEKV